MKYSEFKSEKDFKAFCRENKITIKEYFEKYYPKKDLYTGEKLDFKDASSYFSVNFSDKRNMVKWLNSISKEESEKYIIDCLNKRAKEKEWLFFPCQVETRSTKVIPALNITDYCKNEKIYSETKLKKRFIYPEKIEYKFVNLENLIIGYDTREQKSIIFKNTEMVQSKLNFGDYVPLSEPYFCNVFFERKSISDLWGTVSKGYERFCRELERAKEQDAYIVVVVDYLFSKAMSYNYNKKFSKASSEFIFSRIRDILQKYENVQFVFSGDRKRSPELIKKIILMGENAKIYDLQYLLDMKEIK